MRKKHPILKQLRNILRGLGLTTSYLSSSCLFVDFEGLKVLVIIDDAWPDHYRVSYIDVGSISFMLRASSGAELLISMKRNEVFNKKRIYELSA